MNFYKISRGQLITLWAFGLIIAFACFVSAFNSYDQHLLKIIFSLLVVGGLIFYTLGWKKYSRKKINKKPQKPILVKKKWFVPYFIAGSLFYFAQSFNKNTMDEFIIIIIAILAGVFYYQLKSKIKIKNEAGRTVLTFFILYFVSAVLIGFFTGLANAYAYKNIVPVSTTPVSLQELAEKYGATIRPASN